VVCELLLNAPVHFGGVDGSDFKRNGGIQDVPVVNLGDSSGVVFGGAADVESVGQ
jgi:hypothetical protein